MSFDQACETMPMMLAEYNSVMTEFSDQDIEFLLIDSADLGREALLSLWLNLPILEDDGQLVSESLGIENAGEVFLLNPDRLSLYYRGPVSLELTDSLSSLKTLQDTLEFKSGDCSIEYPV